MSRFQLTTGLPFLIHLKDDDYYIRHKGKEYQVRTKKIWSQFARNSIDIDDYEDEPEKTPTKKSFQSPTFSGKFTDFIEKYSGENIEFINDDTDHFRKTIIQIFWESETSIESDKFEKKIYKELKDVINKFIEIYRSISGDFYLPLIDNLPYRSVADLRDLDSGCGFRSMNVGITSARYNISKIKHQKIKERLNLEDELTSTELSLNAARHLYSKNQYRNSILEAVIALEPIITNVVEILWQSRGIKSKTKIKEQLSKIDLNYMMTIEIPHLIDLTDDAVKNVYDKSLAAITLRNKIVHKNFNIVTEVDCSNAIESIISLISILENKKKSA